MTAIAMNSSDREYNQLEHFMRRFMEAEEWMKNAFGMLSKGENALSVASNIECQKVMQNEEQDRLAMRQVV